MPVILSGSGLTVEKLVQIARHNEKVELAPDALERIKQCRAMLEDKIKAREIMYGVNTGIGEFSETVLTDDQVKDFQKYLIYNHAAGIGEPVPVEQVRAAMAGRINVHAHGNSGCRPEITQTYIDMLNKGVTPVVCQKGSVGACGDLAPMSQIALLLMGEGEAFYKGERLPGKKAMDKAGIPVPGLQARDGLAAINGSNLLTAMSALTLYDFNRWLKQAEIACAMSLESLMANLKPYDIRLHQVRGFKGAQRSSKAILACIQGSDLQTGKIKTKVQDAYSMRSTPQVIGAAHDAIAYAKSQVEIELNGVGDNPIFLPEFKLTLTGANFQGSPVCLPMDMAGAAITMVCVHQRAPPEPAYQSGPERGPAIIPHQGSGHVQRDDAQPVYRRHADRGAAHSVHAGQHPIHPGGRRPGGLRIHGHEHRPQEQSDTGQRLRHIGHRDDGGRPGSGFQGFRFWQGRKQSPGGHPQARGPSGGGSAPVFRP